MPRGPGLSSYGYSRAPLAIVAERLLCDPICQEEIHRRDEVPHDYRQYMTTTPQQELTDAVVHGLRQMRGMTAPDITALSRQLTGVGSVRSTAFRA